MEISTVRFIIGLILSFLAAVLYILSVFKNNKKELFLFQTLSKYVQVLSNYALKGYSGAIVCFISTIRNYLLYNNKMTKLLTYLFCILLIIISLFFNNRGIIGLFPIIASVSYTLVICNKDSSIKKIKIAIIFNMFCWAIFDYQIKTYFMFFLDIAIMFSAIFYLIKNKQCIKK